MDTMIFEKGSILCLSLSIILRDYLNDEMRLVFNLVRVNIYCFIFLLINKGEFVRKIRLNLDRIKNLYFFLYI